MDALLSAQSAEGALAALFSVGRAVGMGGRRGKSAAWGRAALDAAMAQQLARPGGAAALFRLSLDASRPTPVWQQNARVAGMLVTAPHPEPETYHRALGQQRALLYQAQPNGLQGHPTRSGPSHRIVFPYPLPKVISLLQLPAGSAPAEFHRAALDTLAMLHRRHPQHAEAYALAPLQRALRRTASPPRLSETELAADMAALRDVYVAGDGASVAVASTLEPALPGLLQLLAAATRCKSPLAKTAQELLAAYFGACDPAEGGAALATVLFAEWTLSAPVPPSVFAPGGSGGLALCPARDGEEATEAAANPEARFGAVAELLSLLVRLSRPALLTGVLSHMIEHASAQDTEGGSSTTPPSTESRGHGGPTPCGCSFHHPFFSPLFFTLPLALFNADVGQQALLLHVLEAIFSEAGDQLMHDVGSVLSLLSSLLALPGPETQQLCVSLLDTLLSGLIPIPRDQYPKLDALLPHLERIERATGQYVSGLWTQALNCLQPSFSLLLHLEHARSHFFSRPF